MFAESTWISLALDMIPLPPTTFIVLEDAIVPPPVKPAPAVIVTPEWAICSSATKSKKSSCLKREYNSEESIASVFVALL